jgi:glucan phosphoethanolaminetransferase (alkaline phosphatase superfamily)
MPETLTQTMSEFEFIFSLFSLLLGLSLAELLAGLGRALKARLHAEPADRATHRIGWLTPLLALFALFDLLSFWMAAWTVRDLIAVSGTIVMASTLFASAYYLAAHMIFPETSPKNGDLDPHYFKVRRIVMGILLLLLFVQLGFYASEPALAPRLFAPLPLALTAILIALMLAACFVKSRTASTVVLVLLVLRYAVVYLI